MSCTCSVPSELFSVFISRFSSLVVGCPCVVDKCSLTIVVTSLELFIGFSTAWSRLASALSVIDTSSSFFNVSDPSTTAAFTSNVSWSFPEWSPVCSFSSMRTLLGEACGERSFTAWNKSLFSRASCSLLSPLLFLLSVFAFSSFSPAPSWLFCCSSFSPLDSLFVITVEFGYSLESEFLAFLASTK